MIGVSCGLVFVQQLNAARSSANWWDGFVVASGTGMLDIELLRGGRITIETTATPRVGAVIAVNPLAGVIGIDGCSYPARVRADPQSGTTATRLAVITRL